MQAQAAIYAFVYLQHSVRSHKSVHAHNELDEREIPVRATSYGSEHAPLLSSSTPAGPSRFLRVRCTRLRGLCPLPVAASLKLCFRLAASLKLHFLLRLVNLLLAGC
eukprot:1156151-Pelagomonas_calceolata.AAC.8